MITFTGTVLNLDGVPDSIGHILDDDTALELPSHEVPVTFECFNQPEFLLGKAKLFYVNGQLRYKMSINDTRLPEYAVAPLYPCVRGIFTFTTPKQISACKVVSIDLSEYKNCDERILPIGEQK